MEGTKEGLGIFVPQAGTPFRSVRATILQIMPSQLTASVLHQLLKCCTLAREPALQRAGTQFAILRPGLQFRAPAGEQLFRIPFTCSRGISQQASASAPLQVAAPR